MSLPDGFRFSQMRLQDFIDCPRRFELRYVEGRIWPALETEPALEHERRMILGARFHQLVQQYYLGLSAEVLESTVDDPELLGWWERWLAHPVPDLPEQRRAEFTLTAPIENFRLLAKFDLLAWEPGGRMVIVDWKTGAHTPGREWLSKRLQTQVYPFVLTEAGEQLNGGSPVNPENVSLVYWFTAAPDTPRIFRWSAAEHARAKSDLAHLVQDISGRAAGDFPLTEELRACRYCPYRSLCDRGVTAGDLEESVLLEEEAPEDFDFDLEQVAEIEF